MSDYTPTTKGIKSSATEFNAKHADEQFDRWLAGVKAEAWGEGFDAGIDHAILKDFVFNPYSIKSERAQKYIEKTLSEATE